LLLWEAKACNVRVKLMIRQVLTLKKNMAMNGRAHNRRLHCVEYIAVISSIGTCARKTKYGEFVTVTYVVGGKMNNLSLSVQVCVRISSVPMC